MEHSKTKCPTVLLKADTGADVNLMNSNTFDTLFKDRTILQPSSLRMEAYGNSAVEVLGKFHVFLRWKGHVYRQLFYVTNANDLPNLLSRDGCYTLGVINLVTLWNLQEISASSKEIQKWHPHSLQYTWTNPKCKVIHLFIAKMMELKWEMDSSSTKAQQLRKDAV